MSLNVGVSSPETTSNSLSRMIHRLTLATWFVAYLLILTTHSSIKFCTFGLVFACSTVLTFALRFFLMNLLTSVSSWLVYCPYWSFYTFSVRRRLTNFLWSPTKTAWLIKGQVALIASSIGDGSTFSPPDVITNSLIRPVIAT